MTRSSRGACELIVVAHFARGRDRDRVSVRVSVGSRRVFSETGIVCPVPMMRRAGRRPLAQRWLVFRFVSTADDSR